MKILISEQLSKNKFKTPEGYLICRDAILARTGKQEYRRREVFGDSGADNDDDIIEVDRKEEEVFSKATLASFENKPVTVEHPSEDVNANNWKDYQVGFVRDVRRGKTEDGEDVIIGNLVIQDAQAIEEIENGEHCELSCGYDCDIQDEENPQQRNIRGNHVALCQQGRAGIARIVDSKIEDGVRDMSSDPVVVEFKGDKHLVEKLKTLADLYPRKKIRSILSQEVNFNPKMSDKQIEEVARELGIKLKDSIEDEATIYDSVAIISSNSFGSATMYGPTSIEDIERLANAKEKIYFEQTYGGKTHGFWKAASIILKELKTGQMKITKIYDSVKDANSSMIEFLIKDEEEAIKGYERAIEQAKQENNEVAIARFQEIINDEMEHIQELKDLLSNDIHDSVNDSYTFKIPKETNLEFTNVAEFGKDVKLINGTKSIRVKQDMTFASSREISQWATNILEKTFNSDPRSKWVTKSSLAPYAVKDSIESNNHIEKVINIIKKIKK